MKDEKINPPNWITSFFRWFCNDHLSEAVLGDMLELDERRRKKLGKRKADLLFLWNVLSFLQPFAIRRKSSTLNNNAMFNSYVKIGWRNLLRNKGYSFINIGGLALGMAVAMLIGLWVYDEISFDTYHTNYEQIAQVRRRWTDPNTGITRGGEACNFRWELRLKAITLNTSNIF